jgi:hypothetical protein
MIPRIGLTFLLLSVSALGQQPKPPAKGAIPKVLYAQPLAVVAGTKAKLILRGTGLEAVSEVRFSPADVKGKLLGKGRTAPVPNNYPANKLGNSECEIEIETPKNFVGEIEVIAVTPTGSSEVHRVIVASSLQVEKEPNDSFKQAQELALPAQIEGTLGRERDLDVYRIAGQAGQSVRIEVVAAARGAPTDAMLTVYDAQLRVVKIVDDVEGQADPRLTLILPPGGVCYLVVQEAHDLGGAQFGYRLAVQPAK